MSRAGVIARVVSLLIGAAYGAYVLMYFIPRAPDAGSATLVCLEFCGIIAIPVGLIWFPEAIGAATGYIGHSVVNAETPPIFVAIAGWVMLLALPVLAHYMGTFG